MARREGVMRFVPLSVKRCKAIPNLIVLVFFFSPEPFRYFALFGFTFWKGRLDWWDFLFLNGLYRYLRSRRRP